MYDIYKSRISLTGLTTGKLGHSDASMDNLCMRGSPRQLEPKKAADPVRQRTKRDCRPPLAKISCASSGIE